jgi:suppressor for copper-sensitivity B
LPERFSLFGIDTFGYSGRVLLPISIKRDDTKIDLQSDFTFTGELNALVCSDLCVPISGPLSLFLPNEMAPPSAFAQEIAYAKAHVPTFVTGPDIELKSIGLMPEDRKILIELSVPDQTLKDVFIETKLAGYSFSKPVIIDKSHDVMIAEITINGAQDAGALVGQDVILTIVSKEQNKEITVPSLSKTRNTNTALATFWPGFMVILLTSFIGGFILNFMPCVLPILSLKVGSFLGVERTSLYQVRAHFLATAFGILSSFIMLALGLILIRSAGYQIGWGIQFQSPIFLGFISVVLVVFIATLFDLVYVPIPKFAAILSAPVAKNSGYRYDFLSGMLATILATPCSAPFVGTASAFALSGSNTILVSVLFVMGVGLALPWLLFAAMPSLTRFLPSPGRWMVRIKQISAILLIGTLIWILWVFANLVGWRTSAQTPSLNNYEPWSMAAMETAIATNRPVFVDVTADWCITCKVNKISVLELGTINKAFVDADFMLFQADWTRPNDEIAEFLAMNGRFGIPFDILFSPRLETPIILPEILTAERLLDAIQAASLK